MTGSNPTDRRSKLGQAKRHILTDKQNIPLTIVIPSASTHDIKTVIDVMDYAVSKRPNLLYCTKERRQRRKHYQHLCLDRSYSSKTIRQQIIKRGYVPHIPYKRKRGQSKMASHQMNYQTAKNKRRVVIERTNS